MRSFLATVDGPPAVALSLAGSGVVLSFVSTALGILATGLAIAYTAYRWRRDALERTCDVADCPKRHRPE